MLVNLKGAYPYYVHLIVNIPAIAICGEFSMLRLHLVSRLLFYFISILEPILILGGVLEGGINNGRKIGFSPNTMMGVLTYF